MLMPWYRLKGETGDEALVLGSKGDPQQGFLAWRQGLVEVRVLNGICRVERTEKTVVTRSLLREVQFH